MSTRKPSSLRDILKLRQQEAFVGREKELNFFRHNLLLDPDDEQRKFIINIFGLGGIGKTSLVRRLKQIAEHIDAATAYTDHNDQDIIEVMYHLSRQLIEKNTGSFKDFNELHHIYYQRRQELEIDPEAPQGTAAFIGRSLAKAGIKLGRRIPVGGAAFDFVDEDLFSTQVGEWSSYVAKKFNNKDEVNLIQRPIEVLTPIFLNNIRKISEKYTIALFLDTYDETSDFLDDWLRDLIEGELYGDLPVNIVLVVAGRHKLDKNLWVAYERLLANFLLEPFSEKEARQFLEDENITNEEVIEEILNTSKRLPLIVATMADERPRGSSQINNPSATAVERILKWEKDPKKRQLALDASLARQLNRDILDVLIQNQDTDMLFAWLKEKKFVEQYNDSWEYHPVIRSAMIEVKRCDSPQSYSNTHHQLANYYETLHDNFELIKQTIFDERWQRIETEIIYHHLCENSSKYIAASLKKLLSALTIQLKFAQNLATAINQAGVDSNIDRIKNLGEILLKGVKSISSNSEGKDGIIMFSEILKVENLDNNAKRIALEWKGRLLLWDEKFKEALIYFDQALTLSSDNSRNLVDRGFIHFELGNYENAISDLKKAIELKPGNTRAIILQGRTYAALKRYDEMEANFNSVQLNSNNVKDVSHALMHISEFHFKKNNYTAALSHINHAISIGSKSYDLLYLRSKFYFAMQLYEKALEDLEIRT